MRVVQPGDVLKLEIVVGRDNRIAVVDSSDRVEDSESYLEEHPGEHPSWPDTDREDIIKYVTALVDSWIIKGAPRNA